MRRKSPVCYCAIERELGGVWVPGYARVLRTASTAVCGSWMPGLEPERRPRVSGTALPGVCARSFPGRT